MRFDSQMQVDSSILFDKLERRLVERQDKEKLFDGLSPLAIESDKEHIQVIREDEESIEFKYSRLLPFSAERTSNAAWNVIEQLVSLDVQIVCWLLKLALRTLSTAAVVWISVRIAW
ncbi:hypothetical protein P3T76_010260 [Phytophthora citrophthora]|uniref:Uncharacterized protein n=1 Tax=Phytophthora citrophthora TaxID=4793 RepID=A0AAD9GC16_9STRA|nr:hypothetical protein P3T76_010260 [Phytophthora citrophthora]